MKAARRALGERGPVLAEDFVCPDGLVAITLDVSGYLSTVLIDPAKLVDVDAALTTAAARSDYRTIVRAIALEFVASRKRGDDSRLPGVGVGALWCALNHPASGQAMRRTLSAALRKNGKAHLTWHCGPHGSRSPWPSATSTWRSSRRRRRVIGW